MQDRPRHPFVLLVALTAGLTWAGWFPSAHADPFPPTVAHETPIDTSRLVPAEGPDAPTALRPDGALHALRDTRTATVIECAPFWFTSLAVTWDQTEGDPVHVDVRTSKDGTSFGRPQRVGGDAGPDASSPEAGTPSDGTPLIWTGGARCARVSLELRTGDAISGVAVVFINSSGSAAGPGTAPPTPIVTVPDTAAAATAEPAIITREQWGAPAKPACGPYYAESLKMVFVHHTDGPNRYPKSASDDILRGIDYYHVHVRHWCDIAYNFLIDRYGRIFEGRAGGVDQPVISAATQGVNTGSASVALMGNYTTGSPTARELAALRRLLAWRLDVAHVPPIGKTTMVSAGGNDTWLKKGQHVRLRTISGHRDAGWTDCPGVHVYRRLPGIRRQVARMGLPKIYYPTATSAEPGVPPWRFHARGSTTLDWTVRIADENGAVVRTYDVPDEDVLRLAWDGEDTLAQAVAPGTYTVTIDGSAGGKQARPAMLTVRIKPPPSPSPSPSPSP